MKDNTWDWYGESEKESMVIKPVEAVAVYTNRDGDIVIRQRGPMGDDDSVVIVPTIAAQSLIDAIKSEMSSD